MKLTSPSYQEGEAIPAKFGCDGEGVSPQLDISSPPEGTKSFALILEDPDAVKVMGKVYYHWVTWNIPAETTALPEGSSLGVQGKHSGGGKGYQGPCPPEKHQYVFRLYALDTMLDLPEGSSKDDLQKATEGHILAEAKLSGTYTKQK